ncbi:hypothetical protein BCM02_11972 [Paenibacillus methanolicus]|uniref:Uncharacterized protein n=1 Tax=Paenibacillus methanolicus TaxID=582686 RepID=A0A5S5BN09_9BACL|nr:hypothetical protein BCM02_11972 [Paenibacillus methanolicus]
MPTHNRPNRPYVRHSRSATLPPSIALGPQTPTPMQFEGKWGIFTFGANPERYIVYVERFDPMTGLLTLMRGGRQTQIAANEISSVLGPYSTRPIVDGAPHLAYVPHDACVWIDGVCYYNYG